MVIKVYQVSDQMKGILLLFKIGTEKEVYTLLKNQSV